MSNSDTNNGDITITPKTGFNLDCTGALLLNEKDDELFIFNSDDSKILKYSAKDGELITTISIEPRSRTAIYDTNNDYIIVGYSNKILFYNNKDGNKINNKEIDVEYNPKLEGSLVQILINTTDNSLFLRYYFKDFNTTTFKLYDINTKKQLKSTSFKADIRKVIYDKKYNCYYALDATKLHLLLLHSTELCTVFKCTLESSKSNMLKSTSFTTTPRSTFRAFHDINIDLNNNLIFLFETTFSPFGSGPPYYEIHVLSLLSMAYITTLHCTSEGSESTDFYYAKTTNEIATIKKDSDDNNGDDYVCTFISCSCGRFKKYALSSKELLAVKKEEDNAIKKSKEDSVNGRPKRFEGESEEEYAETKEFLACFGGVWRYDALCNSESSG